jgi:ATPase subunit of ABC transporter with duplicated ATPase domains
LGGATKLGYMAQEQELLNPASMAYKPFKPYQAINETETRNFLHYFLFKGDAALRPAGELSFGERARLQLALLVAQGCTFLILDEPINHLDIPRANALKKHWKISTGPFSLSSTTAVLSSALQRMFGLQKMVRF